MLIMIVGLQPDCAPKVFNDLGVLVVWQLQSFS